MSTKVYDAVRFPQKHLVDVLRHYDAHAVRKAREQFERNVMKHTCRHEEVETVGVYEPYVTKAGRTLIVPKDLPDARFATGECQRCNALLKGFAVAQPGIPLPSDETTHQAHASLFFEQREVIKKGGKLATQAQWHRTKPLARSEAVHEVLAKAKLASLSDSRSGRDFSIEDQLDSSVRFRFHDGFAYLQHLGEPPIWQGITWPPELEVEEYEYWNNTDRPDDVTEEAWDERARTWDAVTKDRTVGWMTYNAIDVGRSYAHAWSKLDPPDDVSES